MFYLSVKMAIVDNSKLILKTIFFARSVYNSFSVHDTILKTSEDEFFFCHNTILKTIFFPSQCYSGDDFSVTILLKRRFFSTTIQMLKTIFFHHNTILKTLLLFFFFCFFFFFLFAVVVVVFFRRFFSLQILTQ